MTIQRLWTIWNEALARLLGQPALGFDTMTSRAYSLTPPVRSRTVARVATQSEELSDKLKQEFARIREEEKNILDKLIMID